MVVVLVAQVLSSVFGWGCHVLRHMFFCTLFYLYLVKFSYSYMCIIFH